MGLKIDPMTATKNSRKLCLMMAGFDRQMRCQENLAAIHHSQKLKSDTHISEEEHINPRDCLLKVSNVQKLLLKTE